MYLIDLTKYHEYVPITYSLYLVPDSDIHFFLTFFFNRPHSNATIKKTLPYYDQTRTITPSEQSFPVDLASTSSQQSYPPCSRRLLPFAHNWRPREATRHLHVACRDTRGDHAEIQKGSQSKERLRNGGRERYQRKRV